MTPDPKRVAARHRKVAKFDLSNFLRGAKQKAMDSLFRQVERDIKGKIPKLFEAAFPDWEMVKIEVEQDVEALGFNEPNRYLMISATVKPKPSHPEIEYIWGESETEGKMRLWAEDTGMYSGDFRENGKTGRDLRYFYYSGQIRW